MFRINLLPPEEKKQIHLKEIVGVTLFVIFIGIMAIIYISNYYNNQSLTLELDGLQCQYREYKDVVKQVEDTENRKNQLEKRLVLRDLFAAHVSWAELIKELGYCTPEKLYFSRLSINREGIVTLEGETTDHQQVANFMDILENSSYFFRVTLNQSTSNWQEDFRLTDFNLTMNAIVGEGI